MRWVWEGKGARDSELRDVTPVGWSEGLGELDTVGRKVSGRITIDLVMRGQSRRLLELQFAYLRT